MGLDGTSEGPRPRTTARYGARVEPDVIAVARAIAALTLAAIVLAGVLVLVAIGLRFTGRKPGRRLGTVVVFLFGVQVGGFIVFLEGDPIARAVSLAIAGCLVLGLLWQSRRVQAGAFLAGAAVPWTLVWGYYAFELVRGAPGEPFQIWTMFLAGLVPTLIGLGLMVAGDPLAPEPAPGAAAGQPGSRRIGTIAQVVLAPEAIGPIPVSELAAFVATIAGVAVVGLLGLPFPAEPIAQIALGTLAGSEARILVRPARSRRAFEAFSWLGEWEMARVKAATGRSAPGTRRGVEQFLASVPATPENGWMRVELLLFVDRTAEARAAAEAMPARTPAERFERAYAVDMADWIPGGPGTPDALEEALAGLAGADEDTRLRAEVSMAIREARMIAAERGREAALEPLLRVRDRLGKRADGQLHRGPWRRFLPVSVITAVVVTLLGQPLG
jgi:hypothetical protein